MPKIYRHQYPQTKNGQSGTHLQLWEISQFDPSPRCDPHPGEGLYVRETESAIKIVTVGKTCFQDRVEASSLVKVSVDGVRAEEPVSYGVSVMNWYISLHFFRCENVEVVRLALHWANTTMLQERKH